MEKRYSKDFSTFLSWTKENWENEFHKFSNFYKNTWEEFEMNGFSSAFYDNIENIMNITKFFISFHNYFFPVSEEKNNCTFMDNIQTVMAFVISVTNYSEFVAHEFINDNTLEFILNHILKSDLLKFSDLFHSMALKTSFYWFEFKLTILFDYIYLILNILKHSFSCWNVNIQKLKNLFHIYILDLINYLQENKLKILHNATDKENDTEKYYLSLLILCFLSQSSVLNIHNNDSSSVNFSEQLADIFHNCFKNGLNGDENFFNISFNNDELLEFFIFFSRKPENFEYLKSILPLIFKYLNFEWKENIQILVFHIIYCLLSIDKWKEWIKRDKIILQKLIEPFIKKSIKLANLWKNIDFMMNEGEETIRMTQIIISCHHNDVGRVFERILDNGNNNADNIMILILDSKSKFSK